MTKFLFSLLLFCPVFAFSQIEGEWHASFTLIGTSHLMDLKIEKTDSNYSIQTSNPTLEKVKWYPMEEVEVEGYLINFKWNAVGLSFEGEYNSKKKIIEGQMQQIGLEWPVTFYREKQEKIIVTRSQTPKEPFSYSSEDFLIQNDGIALGATLTLPKNAGSNFPIVVIASGSGPQNRNCELLGHEPFWVIADYLSSNGIGCLRFDDRGVGKSTGNYSLASLQDFASDVDACVNYLKNDARFKEHLIGVAGHSEGGIHALIAARKNKEISFIIELASVGTSGRDCLVQQQYLIPLKAGESEDYARWNQNTFDGLCEIISKNSVEKSIEPLNAFLAKQYALAPEKYKKTTSEMNFKMGTNMFINNTWGREFVAFQAADYLKKIKVPILSINGSMDLQVPPIENQAGFDKNFSKKSRPNSIALIVEGYNHLFQKCELCTIMEYGTLDETFSPEVLLIMKNWILNLK